MYHFIYQTRNIINNKTYIGVHSTPNIREKQKKVLRIKKINNNQHRIFFSGDHHFSHKNVIKFCNRPFTDVREMNNCMIDNWNSVVRNDDTVFYLGDFSFGGQKVTQAMLEQLNGKKFICLGDHDQIISRKCRNYFEAVEDMIFLTVENQGKLYEIFMTHWLSKTWPKSHYGSWHCHGHSHSGMDQYAQKEGKILDVGVDNISKYKPNFYGPISFEEIQKIMIARPNNFNLIKKKQTPVLSWKESINKECYSGNEILLL